jgi:flagellin
VFDEWIHEVSQGGEVLNIANMNATGMKVLGAMNYHQKQASKSLERLSTGLRINSVADDPAGLAMAERMTSEINGARQAAKNVAMGQDMARTADSTLANVQDAIQRFRELAVYAASGTITDEDRAYIQEEAVQLTEYINNIIGNSQFNKIKLFAADTLDYFEKNAISLVAKDDAEAQALRLSVGELIDQNLVMNDIYASIFDYLEKYVLEKKNEGELEDDEIEFDKDKISLKILNLNDVDLSTLEKAISNVERVNEALSRVSAYAAEPAAPAEKSVEFDAALGQNLALNGAFQSVLDSLQNLAAQRASDAESASDFDPDDGVEKPSERYAAIWSKIASEARAGVLAAKNADARVFGVQSMLNDLKTNKKDDVQDKYELSGESLKENIFAIQSGANEGEIFRLNLGHVSAVSLGLYGIDFTTKEASAESISIIDESLDAVSSQRALIGAQINRMEHTIENLEIFASNLAEARSRIMDADIPAEMINFTKHSLQYQMASRMLKMTNDIETRTFRALF